MTYDRDKYYQSIVWLLVESVWQWIASCWKISP
jgi:hypothetical protein